MMHGPLPDQTDRSETAVGNTLVAAFERALALCNNVIVVFAAIALIAACVILSYSVLGRALFHSPNYWQDEAAVFLLVGATFMTAASFIPLSTTILFAFHFQYHAAPPSSSTSLSIRYFLFLSLFLGISFFLISAKPFPFSIPITTSFLFCFTFFFSFFSFHLFPFSI